MEVSPELISAIVSALVSVLISVVVLVCSLVVKHGTSGLIKNVFDKNISKYKKSLNEELESHKAELSLENAKAIEKIKADILHKNNVGLEKLKLELNLSKFTYEKMHERRIEALVQLHESLSNLLVATSRYVAPFRPVGSSPDQERIDGFNESMKDFNLAHTKNKIFISKEIDDQVIELKEKIRKSAFKYFENTNDTTSKQNTKALQEAFEEIEKDAPILLKELEQAFRKVVASEPTDKPE